MGERKAIPKKLRFEVFKRDKFTCQYCGRSAPDVVLQVDHIVPVAKGGKNEIMNLVTSCWDCNIGKGAKELSDDSIIKKQQAQLQELAEKNEQFEMMLKWRNEIANLHEKEVNSICEYFDNKSNKKYPLNENGRKEIKKWLKEFALGEIMDAIDIAFDTYYSDSKESLEYAFRKIPGICHNKKSDQPKQTYWFNYLKKACMQKYGSDIKDVLYNMKPICFFDMQTESDFEKAKSILYAAKNKYNFIYQLEDAFR